MATTTDSDGTTAGGGGMTGSITDMLGTKLGMGLIAGFAAAVVAGYFII
jgi:hypothetical protein